MSPVVEKGRNGTAIIILTLAGVVTATAAATAAVWRKVFQPRAHLISEPTKEDKEWTRLGSNELWNRYPEWNSSSHKKSE